MLLCKSLNNPLNPQTDKKFKGLRANARNVTIRISLQWPIHIINPVDKTKLSCNTLHRRSLQTYPPIFHLTQNVIRRKGAWGQDLPLTFLEIPLDEMFRNDVHDVGYQSAHF